MLSLCLPLPPALLFSFSSKWEQGGKNKELNAFLPPNNKKMDIPLLVP